jgi:hypothetical protein
MEHKGVRYEVRIGIARDQWRVAIYIPDKRLPVERTVFGTREDAETTARSMINAWLKKKSGAACPLPAARFPPAHRVKDEPGRCSVAKLLGKGAPGGKQKQRH